MIEILPYQIIWPGQFQEEARRIRARFGEHALRIDHVGSTSIPGLAAKPVIDIQISLRSLEPRRALVGQMEELGYVHIDLGDFDRVYPFFASPTEWPSKHHVHLCTAGSIEERSHLAFRDFLREHPSVAADYSQLKRELAAMHPGDSLASREAYSLGKTDFVRDALVRAFAAGYPLVRESDA